MQTSTRRQGKKEKKRKENRKRRGKEYFKTTHLLQSALLKASFYKLHRNCRSCNRRFYTFITYLILFDRSESGYQFEAWKEKKKTPTFLSYLTFFLSASNFLLLLHPILSFSPSLSLLAWFPYFSFFFFLFFHFFSPRTSNKFAFQVPRINCFPLLAQRENTESA